MKKLAIFLAVLCLSIQIAHATDTDLKSYIEEAGKLSGEGDLAGAIALMEKATAEHPESSDAFAYLGLYTGMSAGRTNDYSEAALLVVRSFEYLDKGVQLDSDNPRAYLFRGIMGVQIPEFLGKLDGGIADLERASEIYASSSSPESSESLVQAWSMLALGYGKKEDTAGARKTLEKIIEHAPGTEAATEAEKKLAALPAAPKELSVIPECISPIECDTPQILALKEKMKANPGDSNLVLDLGRKYYDAGFYEPARNVLKYYVGIDQKNAEAYRLLALSVSMIAQRGYDENIHKDTDYLSGLAFESMNSMDKAVELAPEDMELRLMRGIFGILFPFFLGKHEQALEDLEMVAASDATEEAKAEAYYYLGVARQREAMRYWIKVEKEFPDSEAARLALGAMSRSIVRFDQEEYEKPFVRIDLVLGYQDELPPQTAIWIEDEEGNYVATVYVSGFSGYAREKQVNLPVWTDVSGFKGLDGVTGASIDVGHHIHVWTLEDYQGKRVDRGTYRVRAETCYWPSMRYQNVETEIKVGKKMVRNSVEEGDYIPYFEVIYYPK
jgi:tetratricopeptide (TPR) repeat protein